MTSRRSLRFLRAPLVLLAATGAVGAAALFAGATHPVLLGKAPAAAAGESPAASSPAAAALALASAEYARVSTLSVYAVDWKTRGTFAIGGQAADVTARVRGELEELVVASTVTGKISLITVKAQEHEAFDEPTLGTLAQGFLIERDPQGRITRIRMPRGVHGSTPGSLASFATLLQTGRPLAAGEKARGNESSALGVLEASYAIEPGTDPSRVAIVRRIEGAVSDPANPVAFRRTSRGELHLERDRASGALVALRGRTADDIAMGDQPIAHSEHELSLTRTRTGADLARAMRTSGAMEDLFNPWQALDAPTPETDAERTERLQSIAGAQSWSDMSGLLAAAATDPAARRALDAKLTAFLALHPEACGQLETWLASHDPRDTVSVTALSALANAGTDPAQHSLVRAVETWGAKDQVGASTALTLLASVKAPSSEVETFLKKTGEARAGTGDMATAAELTLGRMAYELRDSNPARSAALVDDAVNRLATASEPQVTADLLTNLGNSGSDRVGDVAPRYLTDEDAHVRRMAAYALRNATDDASLEALRRIARDDGDGSVRSAAQDALARRGG